MPDRRRKGQPDPDLERGIPRRTVVGRNPDVGAQCPEPGCGESDQGAVAEWRGESRPGVPHGWIYVVVRSSVVPGRWFCSAPCAAVGIALAQLKTVAAPPKK